MSRITEAQERAAAYLARVRGTREHRICPMCDGQGELVEASIDTGERILICDECDSLWLTGSPVDEDHVEGFAVFMEMRNKQPLWTELAIAD
jgi:hypothetical protein